MGTVWLAEQFEPVRRPVAIKVIHPGLDGGDVVVRFEAERQALAMMDHPHIARRFEAGALPDARPYFVMEYVGGSPITRFCDERRLSIDRRVEILKRVCDTVHHAQQRGVIHRDLKPSNVLVVERDGVPEPKIIDFGIAKAIRPRVFDHTMVTRIDQVIGTPCYMSPEQMNLPDGDIAVRSDVYSLGALLYELLTGERPFDCEKLADAGPCRTVSWQDHDRDADLDLFMVRATEPPRLIRNDGGGAFADITDLMSPVPAVEVAAAWGDGDGDLDLVSSGGDDGVLLLDNTVPGDPHWLELNLVGTTSNGSGIGARARVVTGTTSQIREVTAGAGYLSQHSLPIEFGLGAADVIDSLVVRWPSGVVQIVTGVAADGARTLLEPDEVGVSGGGDGSGGGAGGGSGNGGSAAIPLAPYLYHSGAPNPLRLTTDLVVGLSQPSQVRLQVYDAFGRSIRVLHDARLGAGHHVMRWDGRDSRGRRVATGIYFYRIQAGAFSATGRVVRIR
jgi:serine/threonine protein kinase